MPLNRYVVADRLQSTLAALQLRAWQCHASGSRGGCPMCSKIVQTLLSNDEEPWFKLRGKPLMLQCILSSDSSLRCDIEHGNHEIQPQRV
mmetsp:Transcript_23885/g.33182  ORF Transcript_23885/g.33182 Transcript_23885/m.33182 type:complete len:90 (+) Transcript_23885:120-389(+)